MGMFEKTYMGRLYKNIPGLLYREYIVYPAVLPHGQSESLYRRNSPKTLRARGTRPREAVLRSDPW